MKVELRKNFAANMSSIYINGELACTSTEFVSDEDGDDYERFLAKAVAAYEEGEREYDTGKLRPWSFNPATGR